MLEGKGGQQGGETCLLFSVKVAGSQAPGDQNIAGIDAFQKQTRLNGKSERVVWAQ